MRVVVDLTRCQGYAQCAFLAPDVFRMHGNEALMDNAEPGDAEHERVLRAAAACPVQAIQVDRIGAMDGHAAMVPGPAAAAARSQPVPPPRAAGSAASSLRAAFEAFRGGGSTPGGLHRLADHDRG